MICEKEGGGGTRKPRLTGIRGRPNRPFAIGGLGGRRRR